MTQPPASILPGLIEAAYDDSVLSAGWVPPPECGEEDCPAVSDHSPTVRYQTEEAAEGFLDRLYRALE